MTRLTRNDRVTVRRSPAHHPEEGVVVGVTWGVERYDVRTDSGEILQNMPAERVERRE